MGESSDLCRRGVREVRGVEYYGRNYGWAMRFRKSGKAFLSLYPGVAGPHRPDHSDGKAGRGGVGSPASQKGPGDRRGRPSLSGSRWLFVPVRFARDAAAVKRLVGVKLKSGVAEGAESQRDRLARSLGV